MEESTIDLIEGWTFSTEAEEAMKKVIDVPVGIGEKNHMDMYSVSYLALEVLREVRGFLGTVK